MVQWFTWRLGRFRKMGGIYVAFLSHFRFIPTLFCSSQHVRFFLIISSRSLFLGRLSGVYLGLFLFGVFYCYLGFLVLGGLGGLGGFWVCFDRLC
jgi:hypothetical protein